MKFIPHEYQKYATRFIEEHPCAALFLDMGLGRQNRDHADSHPAATV